MSLRTGIIFTQALKSNTELMNRLAAKNVHATAILLPDEDLDNAELPYIIVTTSGATNDDSTKDGYESEDDSRQIIVEVAASTTEEVAELGDMARKTIREYFENADEEETPNYDLIPEDYAYSDDGIALIASKPAYNVNLMYQCDVKSK